MEEALDDRYTNSVRLSATVYEFLFDYGLTQPTVDAAQPAGTTPVVRLRMSPQHAKVLLRVLQDTVEKYERQIAPIQVPAQILQQMGIEP